MINQQLLDFIKSQQALGKSREEISQALRTAGWQEHDIAAAFGNPESINIPQPPQAGTGGQLPGIKTLFVDSYHLMGQRLGVMFVSALIPFLILIGCAIVGVGIWFVAYKINTAASIITAVILGIALFVAYFYTILLGITSQYTALRDATEKTSAKENIKRARPLIGSLFLVTLLVGLVNMGGIVLFFIPGIIFAVWYGFAPFVMVTEGKKGRSALAQSKAYVIGRSWKVFGRMCLLYVAYLVPYIAIQVLSASFKENPISFIFLILSGILQFLFTYYSICFLYTLYTQLKNSSDQKDPQQFMGGVTGWAIWGSVGGVIAIFGLIASLTLLGLNSARAKSRDAKRMADVVQIASSMALYFNENNTYPNQLSQLSPKYIDLIPKAPKPEDGQCTQEQNTYQYTFVDPAHYKFTFCLGDITSGHEAGPQTLTEQGFSGSYTPPAFNKGFNYYK